MIDEVIRIIQAWSLYVGTLLGLLSALVFRAERVPYLREHLFPMDLKRGRDALNSGVAISKESDQDKFRAVVDALRDQKSIPIGLLNVDIQRLATKEEAGGKKQLMAYVVDDSVNQPGHTELDEWNRREGGDGWWSWLGPYSRVQSAIETQIETRSFSNEKISFVLLFFAFVFATIGFLS